jgi:hypothetical protein
MKRVRWLRAQWPFAIQYLVARMKAHLFTIDSFDGFVIDRVREDSVEGRYVEKFSYKESVTDPFGNEEVFDRISYRSTEFTLYSEFPNIELRNGHRNSREFINKLQEICNFAVAIVPINISLLDWVGKFQEKINQKITVDSLQISGLQLEAGISAKILIKGDKDVREALQNLSADRKFILDKLQIKIPTGQKVISINISSNGNVAILEDYFSEFSNVLRQSLSG